MLPGSPEPNVPRSVASRPAAAANGGHTGAQGTSQGSHNKAAKRAASSSGHRPSQGPVTVPATATTASPDANEGRAHVAQGPGHVHFTPAPRTAPASVAGSICNTPMGGLGVSGAHTAIGKRIRARKSTRSATQPAASVQHSNVGVAEGNDSVPDVKQVILELSSGNESARVQSPAGHDVIDLTLG